MRSSAVELWWQIWQWHWIRGCVVLFSGFGSVSDRESASDAVTSLELVAAMASHLSVVAAAMPYYSVVSSHLLGSCVVPLVVSDLAA